MACAFFALFAFAAEARAGVSARTPQLLQSPLQAAVDAVDRSRAEVSPRESAHGHGRLHGASGVHVAPPQNVAPPPQKCRAATYGGAPEILI